ncbi:sigma-70 region 2 [Leptospira kirschneri serovar Valbuzzi str. 200702274]|nr:sigma-70 region 2 [Leptospira kirschneri serovar Valbuzzi str. 200702274]
MVQSDSVNFSVLYEDNYRTVYHFLLKICGDPEVAEDLTQEAFLKAFTFFHKFDSKIAPSALGLVRLQKIYTSNITINRKRNSEIYDSAI